MKFLDKVCNELEDQKNYARLAYEIIRDVFPFYLCRWRRKGFIFRRMGLWTIHVDAYAKIKCGMIPPSLVSRQD